MKKIILTTCLAFVLILPVWNHVCLASNPGNLIAAVQLDPGLKPSLAPGAPKGTETLQGGVGNYVLQLISGSLIFLAGPTAILMLAVGGLRYVTSRGNQTQMEAAKKTITYAIIGLVVIVLSLAIVASAIRMIGELPSASAPSTSTAGTPPTDQGQDPIGGKAIQGGAAGQSQVK